MGRVSIIIPSHRPYYITPLMLSTVNLSEMDYQVCVIGQGKVTEELLTKIGVHRIVIEPVPKVAGLIEMVRWYDLGMNEAPDCDYFLFTDDDHRFRAANGDKPSSGKYYQECVQFMDDNPKVGVFNTKSYFGGAAWKYDIKVNPTNGLININTGMFIRNVPEFVFSNEELGFVGTLVESLLAYKMIALGYDNAKRYYCPTRYERNKRLYSGGATYSHATLIANIQGWIQRTFDDPTWDHESRKYPKGLGR